jgi:hypothetical protein
MPVTQSEAPISPKVDSVRDEVTAASHRWEIVEDCLNGDKAVKRRGRKYLPMPNPADQSAGNVAQYDNYKERAVFYNVTRRTVDGWNGQVFSREPICVMPEENASDDMWYDIDGNGSSLDQQAKLALGSVMAYARGGLLVDYPHVTTPLTIGEMRENYIRPTIHFYGPKSIINWRMRKIGGVHVPELIVLKESAPMVSSDGFSIFKQEQCRVLRLNSNNEYTIEVWQQDEAGLWFRKEFYTMIGPDKKPVTRILFFPIGINRNSYDVDLSPTYDLAVLNIAHYRNSADYEDSCFMVGQPTPVVAGVTQEWVEEVFKGRIELGSRAVIPLPVGGNAQLLQVNANTMTMEAMKHKEAQMVALGARIIKDNSVQKTLGESQMDEAGESSILATASKNVSMAYSMALRCCGYLMGHSAKREDYQYSLNTDFPAARLTPNERAQLVLEWQAEAITESEMRAALRRGGIATLDEKEYQAERKKNPPPKDVEKMQQGQNGNALNQGAGGGNQAGS